MKEREEKRRERKRERRGEREREKEGNKRTNGAGFFSLPLLLLNEAYRLIQPISSDLGVSSKERKGETAKKASEKEEEAHLERKGTLFWVFAFGPISFQS